MSPTNWNQAAVSVYIYIYYKHVISRSNAEQMQVEMNSTVAAVYTSVKECVVSTPPPSLSVHKHKYCWKS